MAAAVEVEGVTKRFGGTLADRAVYPPFARNQPATITHRRGAVTLRRRPRVFEDPWQAALWCAGIFAVFPAIALNRYRKATA